MLLYYNKSMSQETTVNAMSTLQAIASTPVPSQLPVTADKKRGVFTQEMSLSSDALAMCSLVSRIIMRCLEKETSGY